MQIAAVQCDTVWEDRPANHARVRTLLDAIDLAPATLVVLPEMFDTGFSMNTAATDPGEPSASEEFCRELAAERNVVVLAGVVARTGDGRFANEAVAFGPDGAELVRYRKMQPFTPAGEDVYYRPGTGSARFEWQGVRITPFICYDLRFPELFRPAARAGTECFIVLANWPVKRAGHWDCLLRARAIENQAFVLGMNRCGSDPMFDYDGRTSLYDPHGESIARVGGDEQVVLVEIDANAVREWREQFPALRDMNQIDR